MHARSALTIAIPLAALVTLVAQGPQPHFLLGIEHGGAFPGGESRGWQRLPPSGLRRL